eukprot:1083487-Prorocentrum_minimum.AAC.1
MQVPLPAAPWTYLRECPCGLGGRRPLVAVRQRASVRQRRAFGSLRRSDGAEGACAPRPNDWTVRGAARRARRLIRRCGGQVGDEVLLAGMAGLNGTVQHAGPAHLQETQDSDRWSALAASSVLSPKSARADWSACADRWHARGSWRGRPPGPASAQYSDSNGAVTVAVQCAACSGKYEYKLFGSYALQPDDPTHEMSPT